MSQSSWTEEQRDAISRKDANILVAAAAGSGKTSVLVERIISRITCEKEPVDIDRFLVVTFTNAAASEMKERIGKALYERLEADPDSYILKKQIALLNKADIMTIHSFCLNVIKTYFHYLNINPEFRITEETENLLLKSEAIDEVFNIIYETEDEFRSDFLELLDSYGSNLGDDNIKDIVLKIYDFIRSTPEPIEWLKEKTQNFNLPIELRNDFSKTLWGGILIQRSLLAVKNLALRNEQAVNIIDNKPEFEKYRQAFISDQEIISGLEELLSAGSDWDVLSNYLSGLQFERLSAVKNISDKAVQENLKNIRENIKKELKILAEDVFSMTSEKAFEEISSIYPSLCTVRDLIMRFDETFKQKKSQIQVLDFNDLEHYCLEILLKKDDDGTISYSDAANELKNKYEEVLIDEYQDSNLIQEEILKAVGREDRGDPNTFMVGDVKQSIYRFRHANPDLFIQKYNTYSKNKESKYAKIVLNRNFRSRRSIIDFVNYIFLCIMSVEAGEINYDSDEMLYCGAGYENEEDPAYSPDIYLIETGKNDEDEDATSDEMTDNVKLEARAVGEIINKLVGKFMTYDKNIPKLLEYKDVVILSRSVNSISSKFSEELADMGIPVFAQLQEGFYESNEVVTVLSILKIIDNPLQDIPLIAVLRAPFFGFSPDELTRIRLFKTEGSFYGALIKISSEYEEDDLKTKTGEFLHRLNSWREKSEYLPVDELIWYLYEDTQFFRFSSAMPKGEQRQANLRKLFEQAGRYEQTSYRGLFNFINYVEKLKKSSTDIGEAGILTEDENAVRLMSIHKSKGLEFPVVILANCGKRFNVEDTRSSILLNHEEGFGPDFVDLKLRASYPSTAKQALKVLITGENLSEEMRVLYVAMTRAKEKLVITGTVKNSGDLVTRWTEDFGFENNAMNPYDVLKGTRYLDWIIPAVLRNQKYKKDLHFMTRNELPGKCNDFADDTVEIYDENDKEDFREEVLRRLTWKYPYQNTVNIPVKVTVTELKRMHGHIDDSQFPPKMLYLPKVNKIPGFLEEKIGLDSTKAGTVMHYVMQNLDLDKVGSENEINDQLDEMVKKEKITQVERKHVDLKKIYGFFVSEYGRRMLKSGKVSREVPFNILVDAKKLGPGYDAAGEKVLLQGVVDLFFEEEDGIVLLDYKTDHNISEKRIKQLYASQLEYYSEVLESLLKTRVKEKIIYMFSKEKAVVI